MISLHKSDTKSRVVKSNKFYIESENVILFSDAETRSFKPQKYEADKEKKTRLQTVFAVTCHLQKCEVIVFRAGKPYIVVGFVCQKQKTCNRLNFVL